MRSTLQAMVVTAITLTACAYHSAKVPDAPEAAWLPVTSSTVVGSSVVATLSLTAAKPASMVGVQTRVSSSGVQAQLQQIDTVSDSNGYVHVNVTSTHAGVVNLTASVIIEGSILDTGATVPITFVASSPNHLTLTCTNCDGSDAAPRTTDLVVAVVDTFGNPTSSYTGTVLLAKDETAPDGNGASVKPPLLPLPFTAADGGTKSAQMTFTVANPTGWTITASDSVNSDYTATLPGITVSAGAVTRVTLDPFYNPYTACTWTYYAVVLADAYGNNASDYAGEVTLSAQPAFLGDHNARIDVDTGYASFEVSFPGAGNYTMTASANGVPSTGVLVAQAISPNLVLSGTPTQDASGCVSVRYHVDNTCATEVTLTYALSANGASDPVSGSATMSPASAYGVHGVNYNEDLEFLWDATHDVPFGVGSVLMQLTATSPGYPAVTRPFTVFLNNELNFSDFSIPVPGSTVAATSFVLPAPQAPQPILVTTNGTTIAVQPWNAAGRVGSSATTSQGALTSLAVASPNHDGNMVVLACGSSSSGDPQVYVWALDASGAISSASTTSPHIRCGRLVMVDLNGDNHDDIITSDGNFLVAAYNTGAWPPTFNPNIILASAPRVAGFGVADINRDGVMDIAMLTQSPAASSIAISLNANNATAYGSTSSFTAMTFAPSVTSMGLGDIDRDGYVDVAVSNGNVVGVYIGTSSPNTFIASAAYSATVNGNIVQLVDMNHDARLDIVTQGANRVGVALRAQAGNFLSSPVYTPASASPLLSAVVADMDLNGFPDVTAVSANTVLAHVNTPPAQCALRTEGAHFNPVDANSKLGVVGDFNEDGKLDVAYIGTNLINFSPGTGAASIAAVTQTSAIPATGLLDTGPAAVGDMDGDRHLDIILPHNAGSNVLSVYGGDGNGFFTFRKDIALNPDATGYNGVTLANLNADAYLDALVTESMTSDFNTGAVSVVIGSATGLTSVASRFSVGTGSVLRRIFAGVGAKADLNGDGYPDMMTFSPNDALPIRIWLSNQTNGYTFSSGFGTSGQFASMTVGDVTGDGNFDVVGATNNQNIMVAVGKGNGTFNPTQVAGTLKAPCTPQRTVTGRFDSSVGLDLAILCSQEGHIAVAYSTGATAQFRNTVNIPVDPNSGQMGTIDFDTDGYDDLLVTGAQVGTTVAQSLWAASKFVGGDTNDVSTLGNQTSQNSGLIFADTNRRSVLDAVYFAKDGTLGSFTTNVNDGFGNFDATTSSNIGIGTGTNWVAAADFDRDGLPDYALSAVASHAIILYGWGGNQTFTLGGTVTALLAADNNADGWDDLVVGTSTGINLYTSKKGTLPFPSTPSVNYANTPNAMAVAQVALDGSDQILLDSNTTVQMIGANGIIAKLFNIPAGTVVGLASADMDLDGLGDIVVAYVNNSVLTIALYPNSATSGRFDANPTWSYALPYAGMPGLLALGDFDGDTRMDIAFSAYASAVTIASPSTGAITHLSETTGYVGLRAGDLNRDGFMDLGTLTSQNPAAPASAVPLTHTVGTFFGH